MPYIQNGYLLCKMYGETMIKLGDPPAFPTPIDPCPKCKKKDGFTWIYATDSSMVGGYGECNACKAKF